MCWLGIRISYRLKTYLFSTCFPDIMLDWLIDRSSLTVDREVIYITRTTLKTILINRVTQRRTVTWVAARTDVTLTLRRRHQGRRHQGRYEQATRRMTTTTTRTTMTVVWQVRGEGSSGGGAAACPTTTGKRTTTPTTSRKTRTSTNVDEAVPYSTSCQAATADSAAPRANFSSPRSAEPGWLIG